MFVIFVSKIIDVISNTQKKTFSRLLISFSNPCLLMGLPEQTRFFFISPMIRFREHIISAERTTSHSGASSLDFIYYCITNYLFVLAVVWRVGEARCLRSPILRECLRQKVRQL